MQTDVRNEIVAQRRELAGMLGELSAEQWDAGTLCAGWRVREVVAHITYPFRTSPPRFFLELARSRGNFDRLSDRVARRDAGRMSATRLKEELRDNVDNPWTPPGGGAAGALSHDVIHGLDITLALFPERSVPTGRMEVVLGGMSPRSIGYFGTDLSGVRLVATDLEWTFGAGEPVRGRAQDLLMVVCGRRLPAGLLTGAGAGRYTV